MLEVIEGPYLRDLLDQPAALQRAAREFGEDCGLLPLVQKAHRIVLTGMGNSLYVLIPLHLALVRHGLPACLVETAELLYYQSELLSGETVVIAVSQSGRSAEIVTLLDRVRGRLPVIAITNTPASPLAADAAAVILMHAGAEATIACKTYVCSLLALEWLGAHLTGADLSGTRQRLAEAGTAAGQYLAHWREHVQSLDSALSGVTRVFITGRGPSLAAAQTAGLVLKEAAHFTAEGMSSAAFRHGPFESLRDDALVVVMGGEAPTLAMNRKLVEEVRQVGARAELVHEKDGRGPFRIPATGPRPIVEALPAQMMTIALSALADREAGKYRLITKVTDEE
jgi:glucosamine--fructose-6-phosphate aminotransferase (isomerizing)